MDEIALFPLHAVLLPGGRIPLQIFEPRYLDLVSRCMKGQSRFGIVRILQGHEVVQSRGAAAPAIAEIGTAAEIVDWDALPGGRLRITVQGSQRFRVGPCHAQADRLLGADVEWLPDAVAPPPGPQHAH
ncbi:MAG: LON peptidase substrate-binding domain-containing protein, partial [Gammaproteobacteria bacterium]